MQNGIELNFQEKQVAKQCKQRYLIGVNGKSFFRVGNRRMLRPLKRIHAYSSHQRITNQNNGDQ